MESWTALTRPVSPRIGSCELTYLSRGHIDFDLAVAQHADYCATLADLGVAVGQLRTLPDSPDAVFVEDTAVVLDELAVVMSMGADSRRGESEGTFADLGNYRSTVVRLPLHTRLDGGDVMVVGRQLFVGVSSRSDVAGIDALRATVTVYGYKVVAAPIAGCLHFKTGCTYVGDDTVVVNPHWVSPAVVSQFRVIETHDDEPWAANTLRIGDVVLVAAGYPRTRDRLERAGLTTRAIDIDELAKAEAGLTCLSLIFTDREREVSRGESEREAGAQDPVQHPRSADAAPVRTYSGPSVAPSGPQLDSAW